MSNTRQTYYPSLQGLRALSAIAVILFHWNLLWIGWAGVWLFFTISGFVITLTLPESGPYSGSIRTLSRPIAEFYRKRAYRILPLYLLYILVCSAIIVGMEITDEAHHLESLRDIPFLLTATFNFLRMSPSYTANWFFSHLWSISVEEQFYVFYPLLFLTVSRKRLVRFLLALVLLSPLIRAALSIGLGRAGWSGAAAAGAIYQASFAQFEGFALGCVLAIERARVVVWLTPRRVALLAACLLVLSGVFWIWSMAFVPGTPIHVLRIALELAAPIPSSQILLYSVISLGAALLIAHLVRGGGPVDWLLSRAPLTHLGGISFGIYVYHAPLLLFFRWLALPWYWTALLYSAALYAVALASYRLWERPFLHLSKRGGAAAGGVRSRRRAGSDD